MKKREAAGLLDRSDAAIDRSAAIARTLKFVMIISLWLKRSHRRSLRLRTRSTACTDVLTSPHRLEVTA
jgi:hypothetical protein